MKNDYVTKEVRCVTCYCKRIEEANGGLFIWFQSLTSDETYEHFQVMPSFTTKSRVEQKAKSYLASLAKSAGLDSKYLVLDYTTQQHLRDVKPIIGRVFQVYAKVKQAKKGSAYDRKGKRTYLSAEVIAHREGEGCFGLANALHILKKYPGLSHSYKLQQLNRLRVARAFSSKTREEWEEAFEKL